VGVLEMIPNAARLEAVEVAQGSPAWHTLRRQRVGGSEIAAILGLSTWATCYELWRRKRGLDADSDPTDLMDMGSALEPHILAKWASQTGAEIVRPVPFLWDREHPHRSASLDGIARHEGCIKVVEAKYNSGAPWEEVPVAYVLQVTWYMLLTGIPEAVIVAMDSRGKATPYPVPFAPDLAGTLATAVDAFWRHVESGEPPEAVTDADREAVALSKLTGRALVAKMEATEIMLAVESELAECDRIAKEAKAKGAAIRAKAAEQMALHGVQSVTFPDNSKWRLIQKKGGIAWKAYALSLGGNTMDAGAFRGEGSVYVKAEHAGLPAEEEE